MSQSQSQSQHQQRPESSSAASTSIPSYILSSLPSSATPISSDIHRAQNQTQIPTHAPPAVPSSSKASFPPSSSNAASSASTSAGNSRSKPFASALSTNVSDLLLSSLLPPNLPKPPPSTSNKNGRGKGAPRELSTQREALSLPLVSNNFRRFVTRVGPVFYLQDRIEEILFWRKPSWTWAWLITWTFICFQPRTLLLLPSLALILILLHNQERSTSLPSLLGISLPSSGATERLPTDRRGSSHREVSPSARLGGNADQATTSTTGAGTAGNGFTTTTTRDADGETIIAPAVPPTQAESGVDYYMNLQAIQNLMGLISDAYDQIAPRLTSLQSKSVSPTSLPITSTHLMILLLPPTLLLPLTPSPFIPYLLLPLGTIPPLLFHPNLPIETILDLPHHPYIRKFRSYLEIGLLNDNLPDEIGRKAIDRVQVWENERLDPKIATSLAAASGNSNASGNTISTGAATGPGGGGGNVTGSVKASLPPIPAGAWSAKHLRPSDRPSWVKVTSSGGVEQKASRWKSTDDSVLLSSSTEKDKDKDVSNVLALKEGWAWIPGEDWRVDVCGLWSEMGVDDDGWVYSDDSWQNPAATPITEADSPLGGTMPVTLRRVTRRRRWWRRVYEVAEEA